MPADTRLAEQMVATRDARAHHIAEPDAPSFGAEFGDAESHYTEIAVDPQWITVWKMYINQDGHEYGVPVPVTRDLWDRNGKTSLVYAKREDGGYVFSAIEPERKAPEPPYECIVNECNGAHLGGRRKRLPNVETLVKHVRAFHADEAAIYAKYLDQLVDDIARSNPRMMALQKQAGAQTTVVPAAFYCDAEDCARFFDSEAGRAVHTRRDHQNVNDGT